MTDDRMTSAERNSLLVLLRQRERVAKADAAEYAATLMADFEAKLAAVYYPSDHPAWKTAHEAADKAVAEANAAVAKVCLELGIPKAFAPGVRAGWYSRGESASSERAVSCGTSPKPRSRRGSKGRKPPSPGRRLERRSASSRRA